MNNKGMSFVHCLVLLIIITAGIFILFPNTVPFPLEKGLKKIDLSQIEKVLKMPGSPTLNLSPSINLDDNFTKEEELQIPQEVFNSILNNPAFQEYLLGKRKRVIFFRTPDIPSREVFTQAIDEAFQSPDIQASYWKNFLLFASPDLTAPCNPPDTICPAAWLAQNCMTKICIVNPQARRVIAAEALQPTEVRPLLEKYKNW